MRFRFNAISRKGRKIDVLLAGDKEGVVVNEGLYEGDKDIKHFELTNPFMKPNEFPYLSSENLVASRAY
jgi:hypothetical protein